MAFPLSGVIDDFDRANQGGIGGTGWTDKVDDNDVSWNIDTNAAYHIGGDASVGNRRTDAIVGDVEAWVLADNWPVDSGGAIWVWVSITDGGTATNDGIAVYVADTATADKVVVSVWEYVNGNPTQMGSYAEFLEADLQGLGLERVGNTIVAYRKLSGTWGVVSGAGGTTTLGTTGQIGFSAWVDTPISITDFGGGGLVAQQKLRPVADAGGSWNVNGAATTWEAVDEVSPSDSDFAYSNTVTGTPTSERFELGPGEKPPAGSEMTIRARGGRNFTAGDVITWTVKLYGANGTTLHHTSSGFTNDVTTTQTIVVPSATVDAIPGSDFTGGLIVEVEAVLA